MNISREEIKHIANLANINLSNQEIEGYTKDMEDILKFVEVINKVDTSSISPSLGGTDAVNVFRKDEIVHDIERDELLNNTEFQEDGMFKIPKVLD